MASVYIVLCVQMLSLYATRWPVFPKCMLVCYVAIVGMFSLSDTLPMQSYPSIVWIFCQCGRAFLFCLVSYRSMLLHDIGGILWLTLWRCWLHSCRMFILLAECGLVHKDDYKLWDRLFLFWSGFCMVESWACRLSLCLACKPFPGLCACTRTGRWCASVVAIRSLSLFTNHADRRSQINSLDSWCATRFSKTLDVVHRYALLVSNSDML